MVIFVAQLVKNQSAMQETWVGKIPWEGKGYPLQYSGLENPMDYTVHWGLKETEQLSLFEKINLGAVQTVD